jgi:hypothetical protein
MIHSSNLNGMTDSTAQAVEKIKSGEYVKRKADAKTVYVRGAYDSWTRCYCLTDTNDMNRHIYVKRGTLLHVGFTY